MNRLLILITAFFMICGSAIAQDQTGLSKKQMREIRKISKTLAKKNIKEGWELIESTTMRKAVEQLQIRKAQKCQEIVGITYGKKDMVVAKTAARNAAINEYAEYCRSIVTARINTDIKDISGEEANNLVAGYLREVAMEMDGELQPVYSLFRRDRKGKIDVKIYYVVDVDNALAARRKALENAAREMDLSNRFGDRISDFVVKGYDDLKTIGE